MPGCACVREGGSRYKCDRCFVGPVNHHGSLHEKATGGEPNRGVATRGDPEGRLQGAGLGGKLTNSPHSRREPQAARGPWNAAAIEASSINR